MVVETERNLAPYAPVNHILNIIHRFRERGLPDPLTIQELERVGVPPGNAPRTLAALRFLGLVSDEGERTPQFERLGRAATEEYPGVLAEIVKAAYEPVFTVVDPAEDSEIAVHDAFRHYQPQAQRGRMVTLFFGLCREAGIAPGGPPTRRARRRQDAVLRAQPARATVSASPGVLSATQQSPAPDVTGPDYRLLSALMQQLPKEGKWTQARRDKWIEAVAANVDLLIEVIEEAR